MRLNSNSIVFYYLGLLDIAYFDHEIDTQFDAQQSINLKHYATIH